MINPDRSLPVVIPVSLVSPYGHPEWMRALHMQLQMLVVKRCIEDPLFFYKMLARWNEGKRK